MGLFDGNKTELQARIIELEKQVAVKDELLGQKTGEVDHLRKQVERLQDAVLAVQHPTAYRQLKDDEYAAAEPEGGFLELSAEQQQRQDVHQKYLQQIEEPTFIDADDMIEGLKFLSGKGSLESKSVHGNDES